MASLILFDTEQQHHGLKPLTFTRPVAAIRIGIITIAEKWAKILTVENWAYQTQDYLEELFPPAQSEDNTLWVNGGLLPDPAAIQAIQELKSGEGIYQGDILIAVRGKAKVMNHVKTIDGLRLLQNPTDIFAQNATEIRNDFQLLTFGRTSAPITDPFTKIYAPENVFVEEGASIKAALINAEDGPVYIGKNAQIQEGCMIKGPFAMCESSVLNMGAKLRGDSTLGPFCKAGGEISNTVFHFASNKGHDGFIGNSVLGAWCNLGADTNTSNLKNNYRNVEIYSYQEMDMIDTGKLFCGLIMGDHGKSGINTMFNTGTVVGVACNIFGGGFPKKHIPSFSWGGPQDGFSRYQVNKLIETETVVMARRKIELSPAYQKLLHYLSETL